MGGDCLMGIEFQFLQNKKLWRWPLSTSLRLPRWLKSFSRCGIPGYHQHRACTPVRNQPTQWPRGNEYVRNWSKKELSRGGSQDGRLGGRRIHVSAQLGHLLGTGGGPQTPKGMGGTPSDRVLSKGPAPCSGVTPPHGPRSCPTLNPAPAYVPPLLNSAPRAKAFFFFFPLLFFYFFFYFLFFSNIFIEV